MSENEFLTRDIVDRVYRDIGKATTYSANETQAAEIAENLCQFIANKIEEVSTVDGMPNMPTE